MCVESPLTLRFFIVLLSCRCCLLLNLNFEWCARKTDGYFLKMRMYSRKANEIIFIINYYAIFSYIVFSLKCCSSILIIFLLAI